MRDETVAKKRKEELLTDVVLAVFRLNGSLLDSGDRLVAPLGLTSARWQVLGAIALSGGPLTAPQIGAAMGITRQGVQKQLNSLLKEGLVGKRRNPVHERSVLYALTKDGDRAYSEAGRLQAGWAADLAKGITTEELRQGRSLLEAVIKRVAEMERT